MEGVWFSSLQRGGWGIDVDGINCVIHYDPPDDGKVYKHRSGRTARAGNSGTVISFVGKMNRGPTIEFRERWG